MRSGLFSTGDLLAKVRKTMTPPVADATGGIMLLRHHKVYRVDKGRDSYGTG